MFNGGMSLHHFVKEVLYKEQVTEILDHTLLNDLAREENNQDVEFEGLISILQVAITCSSENPSERLDMSDVVTKLSSIRNKIFGARLQQRRTIIQAGKNVFLLHSL